MINNIQTYSTYFKDLNIKNHKINKELAVGKRELDSKELKVNLELIDYKRKMEFIDRSINNNKIHMYNIDTGLTEAKGILESIKSEILKANNSTVSQSDRINIASTIESHRKSLLDITKHIHTHKFLIGLNTYIEIGFEPDEINQIKDKHIDDVFKKINRDLLSNKSLSDSIAMIDQVFDHFNHKHTIVGNTNKAIEDKQALNNLRLNHINKSIVDLEGVDLAESFLKLKQLELTYSALAYTMKTTNELSLVYFLE